MSETDPFARIQEKLEAQSSSPEARFEAAETSLRDIIAPPQLHGFLTKRTEAILRSAQELAEESGVANADRVLRDVAIALIIETGGAETIAPSAADIFFRRHPNDDACSPHLDASPLRSLGNDLENIIQREYPHLSMERRQKKLHEALRDAPEDDYNYDNYLTDVGEAGYEIVVASPGFQFFRSFSQGESKKQLPLNPREKEAYIAQARAQAATAYGRDSRTLDSSVSVYGSSAPHDFFRRAITRAEIRSDDETTYRKANQDDPFRVAQDWLLHKLQQISPERLYQRNQEGNIGTGPDGQGRPGSFDLMKIATELSTSFDKRTYSFITNTYYNILDAITDYSSQPDSKPWETFLLETVSYSTGSYSMANLLPRDITLLFYRELPPLMPDRKIEHANELFEFMGYAAFYGEGSVYSGGREPRSESVALNSKEGEELRKQKTIGRVKYASSDISKDNLRLITASLDLPPALEAQPDTYDLAVQFTDLSCTYDIAGFSLHGVYNNVAYYFAEKDPYRECHAPIAKEKCLDLTNQLSAIGMHNLASFLENANTPVHVSDFAREATKHLDYIYGNNETYPIRTMRDFEQLVDNQRLRAQCDVAAKFGELLLGDDFAARVINGYTLGERIDGVLHAQLEITWNKERYIIDLTPRSADTFTLDDNEDEIVEHENNEAVAPTKTIRDIKDELTQWNMGMSTDRPTGSRGPQFLSLSPNHPFHRVMKFMHQLAPTTYGLDLAALSQQDLLTHSDTCSRLIQSLENLKGNRKLQRTLNIEVNDAALQVMQTNLASVQSELTRLLAANADAAPGPRTE